MTPDGLNGNYDMEVSLLPSRRRTLLLRCVMFEFPFPEYLAIYIKASLLCFVGTCSFYCFDITTPITNSQTVLSLRDVVSKVWDTRVSELYEDLRLIICGEEFALV